MCVEMPILPIVEIISNSRYLFMKTTVERDLQKLNVIVVVEISLETLQQIKFHRMRPSADTCVTSFYSMFFYKYELQFQFQFLFLLLLGISAERAVADTHPRQCGGEEGVRGGHHLLLHITLHHLCSHVKASRG